MSAEARFDDNDIGPLYGRYKRFGDNRMDESFFPILWRDDEFRLSFLEPLTGGKIGWAVTTAA